MLVVDLIAVFLWLTSRVEAIAAFVDHPLPSGSLQTAGAVAAQIFEPVSYLILVGVLVRAVALAGIDEGRELERATYPPPDSRQHIQDLHKAAERARFKVTESSLLGFDRTPYFAQVDIDVGIENLGSHFPAVRRDINEWNQKVSEWNANLSVLKDREEMESYGLLPKGVSAQYGPWNLIQDVTREEQPDWDLVRRLLERGQHPPGTDVAAIINAIRDPLEKARDWPEAVHYRQGKHELDGLRATLDRELQEVIADHKLRGTCRSCGPTQ